MDRRPHVLCYNSNVLCLFKFQKRSPKDNRGTVLLQLHTFGTRVSVMTCRSSHILCSGMNDITVKRKKTWLKIVLRWVLGDLHWLFLHLSPSLPPTPSVFPGCTDTVSVLQHVLCIKQRITRYVATTPPAGLWKIAILSTWGKWL